MSETAQAAAPPTAAPVPAADLPSVFGDVTKFIEASTKSTEANTAFVNSLAKNEEARRQAPWGRRGEDPLTSRGYSYAKFLGLLGGHAAKENCKVELEYNGKLNELYNRLGVIKHKPDGILVPFAAEFIGQIPGEEKFASEVSAVVKAGVSGYDIDEVRQLRHKYWGREKALSWIDDSSGGTLVAPPIQGELIDILRNNEVLMQAGARTLPLPPNGRIVFPRQTAAATAYWVGESTAVTESQPETGDVVLQAKKLGVLVTIPNELFRFASVSVEMFIREDMARVLALRLDKSLLDAVGSSNEPKGLINYANITGHTASTTGSDGNTYEVEDIATMIGKVEDKNAVFRAWIMRPLMYAALANRRADAITTGDQNGPFLFNMFREALTPAPQPDFTRLAPGNLYGYPVLKSTQVSNTRTKGNGTALTYILGGDFTDYLIAMAGAMEFGVSTQGDTVFAADQTKYRGILSCDGAPRREASFVVCDTLLVA